MFAPLQNDLFLRACRRQATPYTPLWLMRQAGRYLPEYCATRAKAGSFMGLATHVDYATEVTLQPLDRYPLDAAILFSDILTVPDAMGLGLSFAQGEGPKFEKVVRDEAAVAQLAVPDMNKLRYVFDAVTSIRKALNGRVPLIGFSGSPWTLACYMVEGGGSDDYRLVKTLMYQRPDLMHRILAVNADSVAAYLNAQIDAGAQAVMIFDSWGGGWPMARFSPLVWPTRVGCWRNSSANTRGKMCHASSSPRAVVCGWTIWRNSTVKFWVWIGRSIWAGRGKKSEDPWAALARRCKATWTRMCCLPVRSRWRNRRECCWTALANRIPTPIGQVRRIFSTWVTASASSPHPSMSAPWWKPYTATPESCGNEVNTCMYGPHRVLLYTNRGRLPKTIAWGDLPAADR